MKRAPASDIIWLFVATRLLLVMGTFFVFILFPVPPHVYPSTPVVIMGLLTSWNHWDAANYTRIPQFVYDRINATTFYPLFPMLINSLAFLLCIQGYVALRMTLTN